MAQLLDLPGPSRRIRVEPARLPLPERLPLPSPGPPDAPRPVEPSREPEREPVRA